MIERAFRGSCAYHLWLLLLASLSLLAVGMFVLQSRHGLGITAMSRDIPWGFYIAQLTFLVGIAASAVMVVLPYYLHDFRAFGRITILGEFLAIPAVLLCPLFVVADLGQPARVMNLFLYPTPNSMLFWDTIVLIGYLLLNLVIGWKSLDCERSGLAPPRWIRTLVYISIPWAVSIHTVTAFLYSGLQARPYWFTAILVPRFLATAFAAGPALLIVLCLLIRRLTRFDPGDTAIANLVRIVTYALGISLFLFGAEVFTAMYSGIPEHIAHLEYLFFGTDKSLPVVSIMMWFSIIGSLCALIILISPGLRRSRASLLIACCLVVLGVWIEKGAGMLTGGLIPSVLGKSVEYFPSTVEILMGIGLYALGALILTMLYKIAISVKEQALSGNLPVKPEQIQTPGTRNSREWMRST